MNIEYQQAFWLKTKKNLISWLRNGKKRKKQKKDKIKNKWKNMHHS